LAAAATSSSDRAILTLVPHHFCDLTAHDLHAGIDAFGHFQAKAMDQLLINARALPLPVIHLVHDLEVARVTQGLGVGTIPDRARAHFRCQHQFGEFFGGFAFFAAVHDTAHNVVAGKPEGAPLLAADLTVPGEIVCGCRG